MSSFFLKEEEKENRGNKKTALIQKDKMGLNIYPKGHLW
jgi:hypothetical protein